MAADGVAQNRRGADKILVLKLTRQYPLQDLVAIAKQRWIIERDYEELKQELGLGHHQGRGGEDSIITPRSASPPMVSSSPREAVFPPQRVWAIADYQRPNSHQNSTPAGRVRPERHNPSSIATLRIQISRQLLRQLSCCAFAVLAFSKTVV
jgi:hypothetical protein